MVTTDLIRKGFKYYAVNLLVTEVFWSASFCLEARIGKKFTQLFFLKLHAYFIYLFRRYLQIAISE